MVGASFVTEHSFKETGIPVIGPAVAVALFAASARSAWLQGDLVHTVEVAEEPGSTWSIRCQMGSCQFYR